jgi:hypothetical protein
MIAQPCHVRLLFYKRYTVHVRRFECYFDAEVWAVWHHFFNLLASTWSFLVAALGTTTLSIVLFSFALPILVWFATGISEWLQKRHAGISFKVAIRVTFLSWPTAIAAGLSVLAWICLLSWSFWKTVYNDHQNLACRLRAVVNEKDKLKHDLQSRDAYITRLKDANDELKKRPEVCPSCGIIPRQGGSEDAKREAEKKKKLDIRTRLGYLLQQNQSIRTYCIHPEMAPPAMHFSCVNEASLWSSGAYNFITANMESSYGARFVAATGYSKSYSGVTDQNVNNAITTLEHKATAITEFIKEQQ